MFEIFGIGVRTFVVRFADLLIELIGFEKQRLEEFGQFPIFHCVNFYGSKAQLIDSKTQSLFYAQKSNRLPIKSCKNVKTNKTLEPQSLADVLGPVDLA